MFVDLVGATELAQVFDPEDLRMVMRASRGRWSTAITRLGGDACEEGAEAVAALARRLLAELALDPRAPPRAPAGLSPYLRKGPVLEVLLARVEALAISRPVLCSSRTCTASIRPRSSSWSYCSTGRRACVSWRCSRCGRRPQHPGSGGRGSPRSPSIPSRWSRTADRHRGGPLHREPAPDDRRLIPASRQRVAALVERAQS